MQVDYIVVGLGLAGLAFTQELEKNNKTFIVFEDESQNSSLVAGGMYNPVILKRFSPVWNAIPQLEKALPFYKKLEAKFNNKYDYKIDIYRIFKTVEEQNNWFVAADKPRLSPFMNTTIVNEKYKGINSECGFGRLTKTGRIDTISLLSDYKNYLLDRGKLIKESFDYEKLKISEKSVVYKKTSAKKIVFCEGFGIKKNPFFNYLPMVEVKGELITIHAPELNVDFLIKAAVFVLPLGDNYYRVGATFNWKDKTSIPTEEGKEELISKLKSFITVPFKVVEHKAGIRPTIKDRRPLVGKHPKHLNLVVLNGLGTRGVMIAPTVSEQLYNHLEKGIELDKEVSIQRFH
ncbi:FAD-binding oxidoreductase [Lutibacter sp. TH_r2]|uniref:NAD(P)/FAD-dependent oxidoreductase n=1 Tax=Lutibacter sp. TH_r2 TaxID=3082083 RepID=UPI002952E826|nr:FAD-binding oxidoreductase [Lutibacter sp. TH_r2]MDV7187075.1 FAD-binding oxidoreductase [Lutibacter sp. TH_r2]